MDRAVACKGLLHDPVSAPFVGSSAQARIITLHVASQPLDRQLGAVVYGLARDRWQCADPLWSTRVQKYVVEQGRATSAGDSRQWTRCRGRRRILGPDPPILGDAGGAGVDDDGSALPSSAPPPAPDPATPVHRSRRAPKEFNPDDIMGEALEVCVQQTCGLPSSSRLVSAKSSVTATLVTQDDYKSRAIVLRYGTGKRDLVILWVSCRGGVMCSCFGGTQNALILAASSRSTRCKHKNLLATSLTNTGIKPELFQSHMALVFNAAEHAVGREFGTSSLWVVLYRSVYSLVTFTAANSAPCIAPG